MPRRLYPKMRRGIIIVKSNKHCLKKLLFLHKNMEKNIERLYNRNQPNEREGSL